MQWTQAREGRNYPPCGKAYTCLSEATVPKVNIITGRAWRGYAAMNSKHLGCDVALAPSDAEITPLSPEAAVSFMMKEEISASPNPIEEGLWAEITEGVCNPIRGRPKEY